MHMYTCRNELSSSLEFAQYSKHAAEFSLSVDRNREAPRLDSRARQR